MIVYGQNGKGKGKLGSSVYLINHGVQVKREYTASVSNPSTEAQVNQRTRFKLASQVSAVLEPVIAIPRQGIRSPRNLFVKRNMNWFYGSGQEASVTYENLQLTAGCVGIPAVIAGRNTNNELFLQLAGDVSKLVTHVVYAIYKKTDEGLLQFCDSVVAKLDDNDVQGFTIIDDIEGDLVIYAYGIKGRNAKAVAKYGSYQVETAMDIARLVATRAIEGKDYMFTATRGTTLAAGEQESPTPDTGKALLYVRGTNGGSVQVSVGGNVVGTYSDGYVQVTLGEAVTLVAQHPLNRQFFGWYYNGEQQPFSTESSVSFDMASMTDIVAVFSNVGGLE